MLMSQESLKLLSIFSVHLVYVLDLFILIA
jgi:hypothetical protein